jgi:hypothetical protein
VKVSLHEPGPARYALTNEWIRKSGYQAPAGKDRRLANEWERPGPVPPRRIARPLTIVVPDDEVIERETTEVGEIIWIAPPLENTCVHFDIVYVPAGAIVTGHPGARNMGTGLVGEVLLENEQRVFVTWFVRPKEEATRRYIEKLRTAHIVGADGNPSKNAGMLAFETKPNPDAADETRIGTLLHVTRTRV